MVLTVGDAVATLLKALYYQLLRVPGSEILARYIRNSYQNDPYRVFLETLLVVFVGWHLFKNQPGRGYKTVALSERQIDEIVEEWEPEPLAKKMTAEELEEIKVPALRGKSDLHVVADSGKHMQNWASHNFLGVHDIPEIKEQAIKAVHKYGVGTCGPCGFYGTLDVHMELEDEFAKALGTEAAIVYSQGYSAVGSVIPAFAKHGDIIVADDEINFAIQKGLEASRSTVYTFKHNDMEDLERILRKIAGETTSESRIIARIMQKTGEDKGARKKKLTRRFIVVEGIYQKCGDCAPLDQLVALKEKYKFLLLADESLSMGVLGPRGLGLGDKFNIPNSKIDMLIVSFCNALGSAGGICAGSAAVIDHQRLFGQAYCYSASLPALLAVTAKETLKYMLANPKLIARLHNNISAFRRAFLPAPTKFVLLGDDDSPFLLLQTAQKTADPTQERQALQMIVDRAGEQGLLLTRAKYVDKDERIRPRQSIKICLSAGFSETETVAFAKSMKRILEENSNRIVFE